MKGQDALVLMPTGSGKSLCYQIPALAREGMGIVISPLISLMGDQVQKLHGLGVRAHFLNSSLKKSDEEEITQAILDGEVGLLYMSPERFCKPAILSLLKKVKISLIAVDEVHCLSVWGHDFRPDYRHMCLHLKNFDQVPKMALTATAGPETQSDIIKALGLKKAQVFKTPLSRPYLQLTMRERRLKDYDDLIKEVRARKDKAGIIYAQTRKECNAIYRLLKKELKIPMGIYHGGLAMKSREAAQDKFIKGKYSLMVATLAFGMGIDKRNVRFVFHYGMPKNCENYYQETGRAGRDREASECILWYHGRDIVIHKLLARKGRGKRHPQYAMEVRKIERMASLCRGPFCRERVIINLLGEHGENCGQCDNCLSTPDIIRQTFENDFMGVLRLLIYFKGKVGIDKFIKVLQGIIDQNARQKGLFNIEYFGIWSDHKKNEVYHRFYLMEQLSLIKFVDRSITLGPQALDWVLHNQKEKAQAPALL